MKIDIEIKDVRKSYKQGFFLEKKEVLHGVSFKVKTGAVVGLLGPNGAGKTTTIKILMGISNPDSGEVYIFGKSQSKMVREKIGFLPETPYFYDYLTGREILKSFAGFFSIKVNVERRIDEVIELVGLKGHENKWLRSYSKGMLQRIGLAQAILHDPQLLVLDEPMSGLDPMGRREFRDIITSLKKRGKTILFSSHILQDVEMICDEVVMIYNGRVIKQGVLEEMLSGEIKYYEVTVKGVEVPGFEPERRSGKRVLYRVEENEVDELIKKVVSAGGKVKAVIPRSLNLEEIFIREVQKA
ncbi:MAG: ABC transporter ATP-binding protein [Candidatus Aminicenantes bacterium]|nr:ABC transporter ATP-binding protein [Candidatus Aminicenantes bacterium]